MVPMSIGFLVAGPISGKLSDRYGQRGFSTAGMVVAAASFFALLALPINFVLRVVRSSRVRERDRSGTVRGAEHDDDHERGARGPTGGRIGDAGDIHELGIRALDRDLLLADGRSASPARLPATLSQGPRRPGCPAVCRPSRGRASPGRDPVRRVPRVQPDEDPARIRTCSQSVGPAHAATLTGKTFFPNLISGPFHFGLVIAFSASAALCAAAAVASWWAGDSGGTEKVTTGAREIEDMEEAGRGEAGRSLGVDDRCRCRQEHGGESRGGDGRRFCGSARPPSAQGCRAGPFAITRSSELLVPAGHSAGGARRYTAEDISRIAADPELQELLGFDLGGDPHDPER